MIDEKYLEENGEYLQNNPDWHTEDSPWKANWILKMITKNRMSPSSVVEIGCGAGEILNELQKKMPLNVDFSGFDIAIDAIKTAKKKETERLKFYHSNLFDDKKTFDLLLGIDVFEHVEDYLGFLKECKDMAEYKIFHIPLDISAQTVLRNRLMTGRLAVGHLHYFMKETALASLKDTGYEVIDFFYTAGMVELPNKAFTSRLLAIPRRILFKIHKDFAVRLLGGYSLMVLVK